MRILRLINQVLAQMRREIDVIVAVRQCRYAKRVAASAVIGIFIGWEKVVQVRFHRFGLIEFTLRICMFGIEILVLGSRTAGIIGNQAVGVYTLQSINRCAFVRWFFYYRWS